MSLIWTGTEKPKRVCEVCGGKENVCRCILGIVCGACLLWAYPIIYGGMPRREGTG